MDNSSTSNGDSHDLSSLFSSSSLIRNNEDQVEIDSLKGKKIGLYFSASSRPPCQRFTPTLMEVYNELAPKGDFEIVFVTSDEDEEDFKGYFSKMPWLAIPFSDLEKRGQLDELFKVSGIPHLVLLDENGAVMTDNGVDILTEHGVKAYPFTPEKFAELAEIQKAKEEAQTLESVLVSGDRDFVIGKNGVKVPVSDLVGKNILLYFSAHWCPPCRAFTPILTEAYHKIKAKDDAFEVIFISSDMDQNSFDDYFSGMPWLALPFGDDRKALLSRTFEVKGIPKLVALGPTGRTITKQARELITLHGADAYPFTPSVN